MGFMFKQGDRVRAAGRSGTITKTVSMPVEGVPDRFSIWYGIHTDDGLDIQLPGKAIEDLDLPESFIVELTVECDKDRADPELLTQKLTRMVNDARVQGLRVTASAAWRMFEEPPEDSNAGQWGAQNLDDHPEPF